MIELRPRLRPRPRRPIRLEQWAIPLRMEPPKPVLNARQRLWLTGAIVEILSMNEPGPLCEDPDFEEAPVPWLPDFRPAPFYQWLESDREWGLRWVGVDEFELSWDEQLLDDPSWFEALYTVSEVIVSPDRVTFRLNPNWQMYGGEATVTIHAGFIEVMETEESDDVLISAAQGLTGWAIRSPEGDLLDEPVRCADCAHAYILQQEDDGCPRCEGEWVTIGWEEPTVPQALPEESAALTKALLDAGLLTLCGPRSAVVAAVRPAIAAGLSRQGLLDALLACPAVDEVYGTDALLEALIACW